jgi:uncharacterized protein YcbK (DUF882 family)
MYETEHFKSGTGDNLSCPCCGVGGLCISTLVILELVRQHFGKPVKVTSGARCEAYNAELEGTLRSKHLVKEGEAPPAKAADIQVKDTHPHEVYDFLDSLPFANLLGLGKYEEFTHVDTRGWRARW